MYGNPDQGYNPDFKPEEQATAQPSPDTPPAMESFSRFVNVVTSYCSDCGSTSVGGHHCCPVCQSMCLDCE